MKHVTYSAFRQNLASLLDQVNDDHAPLLVTRQNGAPAVVISLEDFSSWQETLYLRASPKNAERLNQSIAELRAGRGLNRDLIEK
ncbi:MAG: type II toxin-antitoxin system prevent-host-death family antitoxin [Asticcacaulis sp.]|nr:type II toxin-antitoxin system prevent-host-death family antitoxin [Asticcacaulis sp.]